MSTNTPHRAPLRGLARRRYGLSASPCGSFARRACALAALFPLLAPAGCKSIETLTPAIATPERVGYGASSYTTHWIIASSEKVLVGSVAHASSGPSTRNGYDDSFWRVYGNGYRLELCAHGDRGVECRSAPFEGDKVEDNPSIVVQSGVGAPGRTEGERFEQRGARPAPNRGTWVTTTRSIFYCSLATGSPFCAKAPLRAPGRGGWQVLASAVIERSAGDDVNTIWLHTPRSLAFRCEAGARGMPACTEAQGPENKKGNP